MLGGVHSLVVSRLSDAMDHLEDEAKQFFLNAKRSRPETRDVDFQRIKNEYLKTLEDAEEKVNLSNQMYELVDKYLRRLDQELEKFKNELEADNAGITQVLEKRSHELDAHPNHSSHFSGLNTNHNAVRKKLSLNSTSLAIRESMGGGLSFSCLNSNGTQSNPLFSASSASSVPLTLYNANNPLAAAASQAIAATQQMQSGRRTASLKASFDAVNLASAPFGFSEPFSGGLSSFSGLDAGSSCSNRSQKRNRSSSQFHDPGTLIGSLIDTLIGILISTLLVVSQSQSNLFYFRLI